MAGLVASSRVMALALRFNLVHLLKQNEAKRVQRLLLWRDQLMQLTEQCVSLCWLSRIISLLPELGGVILFGATLN